MNYQYISKDNMLNGDGLRTVLWVSGCLHQCKECQNPFTWNPNSGFLFDERAEQELFDNLSNDWIQGITFSGGDPLHPANRNDVERICRKIITEYPDKDIYLYTGHIVLFQDNTWILCDKNNMQEELPWLCLLDIIIDGPYLPEQRKADIANNADPLWRGSSNQRVISVKQSMKSGKIVLHCK